MIVILACGLTQSVILKQGPSRQLLKPLLLIAVLLILPRIIGLLYGQWDNATKELMRSAPLLVLPFSFLLLANHNKAKLLRKYFFYGLMLGVVVMAAICYWPVITTMIAEEQPLSYLMRWRYMNFNFTAPLDGHPAYFGLLVAWLIGHVLFTDFIKPKWRIWVALLLGALLFQLVARNALLVALIMIGIYVVKSKIRWLQISSLALLLAGIAAVIWHPSDYLQDKFFYVFSEEAKQRENTRFERLEASFEAFKQAPVFGPGPGEDNELRMQAYKRMGEMTAYENNYNAHNQFVEFLSTFGLVGLALFLAAIVLLCKALWRSKNWVDLYLFCGLLIAMLTESLLERSLGVKYMSILVAFILLNRIINQSEDHLPDGSRP